MSLSRCSLVPTDASVQEVDVMVGVARGLWSCQAHQLLVHPTIVALPSLRRLALVRLAMSVAVHGKIVHTFMKTISSQASFPLFAVEL